MKAGEYFNTTTPKIINSIPSAEQPKNIPEPLTKTMEIAETTTSKAAQVTGYVGRYALLLILLKALLFFGNEFGSLMS